MHPKVVVHTTHKRYQAGLCQTCGKVPYTFGKKSCQPCLDKYKEKYWAQKNERIAHGICTRCGTQPALFGDVICPVCKARRKANKQRTNQEMWDLFFAHYGDSCACCGESNKLFLTVDHINGDGHLDRKRSGGRRTGVWRIVTKGLKGQWPSDLQVLCFNCNLGKQRNKGVCPHHVTSASCSD